MLVFSNVCVLVMFHNTKLNHVICLKLITILLYYYYLTNLFFKKKFIHHSTMTITQIFRTNFCTFQHRLFLPLLSIRSYSIKPSFNSRPAPVPLEDPQEQKEFEELVRKNLGSFTSVNAQTEEELTHPDLRKRQPPQFEGDKNPETGEIGGPKQEPLTHGDWSYGSRVTDF
ncbi:hypothetical protein C1645_749407 [Glomus cerebriforme]|uniref:Succinate dehydrogenase assembly factor 4, mitochondrial n=1 Tax=Glomus cerebriforme TaxID=658196 RepID=A0A397TK87_9GLOM|nr:hypothetical protein C1645_749407 [Glomus cerebriforme]